VRTFSEGDENVDVEDARLSVLDELDRRDFAPHAERQLEARLLLGERDLGAEAVVEQAPAHRSVLGEPRAPPRHTLEHLTRHPRHIRLLTADRTQRDKLKTRYRPGGGETICPRRWQFGAGKNRGGSTSVR